MFGKIIISAIVAEFYPKLEELHCLTKTKGFLVFGNIFYCQHLLCFETLDTLEDPTFIHNFLLGKVQQGMSAHKGLVIAC